MKHIRKRQSLVRLIVSVLFCLTLVLQVFPAKAVDYTITITLTATPHLQKMTMTVAVTTSPKTVAFTGFWVDIYRSGSKVDVLEWRDSVGRDVDGVSWNFTSSFDITNGLPSEQTLTFVCYVYNAAGDVVSSGSTSKDPPINHNYSPAWYEPATCTDPGYSVQQCSTCGYTVKTSISGQLALGHDYSGSTYVHDSTTAGSGSKHYRVCQRSGCGYREVSTCKLDIIDMVVVTCTDQSSITQQCSNCGYTIKTVVQEPLGHSFTNYIPDGNAACTTDGTKTAVCDRCTETDTIADSGSALGHSFTNYIPDGNAACTADGTETAVCDRCTETDTIADSGSALGHSFTNYISDGNATCTHDGTKSAVCDRCTETDTIADSGSALGHDLQRDASRDVAATCTTAGMEAYTCSRCPEHDDAATVALGHDFQRDASRDVPVACTAQGLEAYTCSRCVEKNDVVIAALGHVYNAVVTQPTCETGGFTTHTCSRCGETHTDNLAGKLSHWYGEWIPEGGGSHTAACIREGCTHQKTVPCVLQTALIAGHRISFCPICGQTDTDERLLLVEGVSVKTLNGTLPYGEWVIRHGMQADGAVLISIAYEHAANLQQPFGKMRFRLPVGVLAGMVPELIKNTGTGVSLPFTVNSDYLVFELDYNPATGTGLPPVILLQADPVN